jgi:hypothetical protein
MAVATADLLSTEEKVLHHDSSGASSRSTLHSVNDHERSDNIDVEQDAQIVTDANTPDEKLPAYSAVSHDANVVDWDGPDDPEKAMNWTRKKTAANVAIVGLWILRAMSPTHVWSLTLATDLLRHFLDAVGIVDDCSSCATRHARVSFDRRHRCKLHSLNLCESSLRRYWGPRHTLQRSADINLPFSRISYL